MNKSLLCQLSGLYNRHHFPDAPRMADDQDGLNASYEKARLELVAALQKKRAIDRTLVRRKVTAPECSSLIDMGLDLVDLGVKLVQLRRVLLTGHRELWRQYHNRIRELP